YCIYVTGIAKNGHNGEFGHALNLVKINGQYYGVDTNWGDPVFDQAISGEAHTDNSYEYLCVPDEIIERSRITDTDLLYYRG
ncbi:transglutaminase, partial [Streptococcus suis]